MKKQPWEMSYQEWLVYARKIVEKNKKTLKRMKKYGNFVIFDKTE